MKIFLTALLCLLLSAPVFADQRTTVLTEDVSLHNAKVAVPYIDGSNDVLMEKEANSVLSAKAKEVAKRLGGGEVAYKVMLNRPSLLGILIEGNNNGYTAYKAVNIDLTTGKELSLGDFFVDDDNVKARIGNNTDLLFTEEGIRMSSAEFGAYDTLVPYSDLLTSVRIGEAGRIFQIYRLTNAAAGKTLNVENNSLLAIKLDSNPSTGFRWDAVLPAGMSKVGSSFVMPNRDDRITGAPGVEIMFLAVKAPGSYSVKMEYKRPWESMSFTNFTFNINAR